MTPETPENIDDYIAQFPQEVQALLEQIRAIIKEVSPDAKECIKYAIPTFVQNGNLVHFAAYKNHVGFYPTPSGIRAFEKQLSSYKSSKGAVQFLMDKPLPLNLITEIVKFRVAENLQKAKSKKE